MRSSLCQLLLLLWSLLYLTLVVSVSFVRLFLRLSCLFGYFSLFAVQRSYEAGRLLNLATPADFTANIQLVVYVKQCLFLVVFIIRFFL